MRSRLDDLLATADRQLASRSYDAAIDTYRTALGEPGAAEASVEELLEAVCRARGNARGIVRPPTAEIVATPVETLAPKPVESLPEPQLEPPPPEVIDHPLEPPRFLLVEDDPTLLERPGGEQYPKLEVENLSILHPAPPPERENDAELVNRMFLAIGAFIAFCGLALFLKYVFS